MHQRVRRFMLFPLLLLLVASASAGAVAPPSQSLRNGYVCGLRLIGSIEIPHYGSGGSIYMSLNSAPTCDGASQGAGHVITKGASAGYSDGHLSEAALIATYDKLYRAMESRRRVYSSTSPMLNDFGGNQWHFIAFTNTP